MSSKVLPLLLIVLIPYILYQLYKYYYRQKMFKLVLLDGTQLVDSKFYEYIDYTKAVELKNVDLNTLDLGYGFTVIFDIYIESVPSHKQWTSSFAKSKPILKFNYSPNIYYNPKNNYLDIVLLYKDNDYFENRKHIKIENILVNRWNKIAVRCKNRDITVYLNNKIVNMITIPNVPILNRRKIHIGEKNNNFIGKLKNMVYYSHPIDDNLIIT